MNENAISNVLVDVDFLEEELQRIGREHLASVFTELRTVSITDSANYISLIVYVPDHVHHS
jgi:hypothetical protein